MSVSDEGKLDEVDFSWGLKKGLGGKHGDVQIYNSFTYDGVEYFLYDSVYLFKDGVPEPYIGKLIQIYELPNKERKVIVLWFFRPSEVSNFLGGENVLENELFLGTGCGRGLANINPLDESKWVGACNVPWEERMKEARDRGSLVLLLNLDPTYTSHEVENIVWHGLGYGCTAKMVPHIALSSPHSGQAFAIFKTPEAAKKIVRKLDEECLILPNGRALVGVFKVLSFSGKKSSYPGHLVIDKLRHQMSRESRDAVSTSHTSQPNNLEYEMALDWRMLQERSNMWWKTLYKKQIEEIESLKTRLKSK